MPASTIDPKMIIVVSDRDLAVVREELQSAAQYLGESLGYPIELLSADGKKAVYLAAEGIVVADYRIGPEHVEFRNISVHENVDPPAKGESIARLIEAVANDDMQQAESIWSEVEKTHIDHFIVRKRLEQQAETVSSKLTTTDAPRIVESVVLEHAGGYFRAGNFDGVDRVAALIESVSSMIVAEDEESVVEASYFTTRGERRTPKRVKVSRKKARIAKKFARRNRSALIRNLRKARKSLKKLFKRPVFRKRILKVRKMNEMRDREGIQGALIETIREEPNIAYLTITEMADQVRRAFELESVQPERVVVEDTAKSLIMLARHFYPDSRMYISEAGLAFMPETTDIPGENVQECLENLNRMVWEKAEAKQGGQAKLCETVRDLLDSLIASVSEDIESGDGDEIDEIKGVLEQLTKYRDQVAGYCEDPETINLANVQSALEYVSSVFGLEEDEEEEEDEDIEDSWDDDEDEDEEGYEEAFSKPTVVGTEKEASVRAETAVRKQGDAIVDWIANSLRATFEKKDPGLTVSVKREKDSATITVEGESKDPGGRVFKVIEIQYKISQASFWPFRKIGSINVTVGSKKGKTFSAEVIAPVVNYIIDNLVIDRTLNGYGREDVKIAPAPVTKALDARNTKTKISSEAVGHGQIPTGDYDSKFYASGGRKSAKDVGPLPGTTPSTPDGKRRNLNDPGEDGLEDDSTDKGIDSDFYGDGGSKKAAKVNRMPGSVPSSNEGNLHELAGAPRAIQLCKKAVASGTRCSEQEENEIAQHPQAAYSYAMDTMKGRFKKGEQAINSDPKIAALYKKNVLKMEATDDGIEDDESEFYGDGGGRKNPRPKRMPGSVPSDGKPVTEKTGVGQMKGGYDSEFYADQEGEKTAKPKRMPGSVPTEGKPVAAESIEDDDPSFYGTEGEDGPKQKRMPGSVPSKNEGKKTCEKCGCDNDECGCGDKKCNEALARKLFPDIYNGGGGSLPKSEAREAHSGLLAGVTSLGREVSMTVADALVEGHSFTSAAGDSLDALMKELRSSNPPEPNNAWNVGKVMYFYEIDTDVEDGGLTGTVESPKEVVGQFRIAPSGKIENWPKAPKAAIEKVNAIAYKKRTRMDYPIGEAFVVKAECASREDHVALFAGKRVYVVDHAQDGSPRFGLKNEASPGKGVMIDESLVTRVSTRPDVIDENDQTSYVIVPDALWPAVDKWAAKGGGKGLVKRVGNKMTMSQQAMNDLNITNVK